MIKQKFGKLLHYLANKMAPDSIYHNSILPSAPYDYVQTCLVRETERFIPEVSKQSELKILIVGAFTADEVFHFQKFNPEKSFKFWLYEANPETAQRCIEKFKNNKDEIKVINKAVGSQTGKVKFYENSVFGTGSVLELSTNKFADLQLDTIKQFEVDLTYLDKEHPSENIDILWIDTQGYEKEVLLGAAEVLKRTKAVFIEVQHNKAYYKNGALFEDIDSILKENGFAICLLGIDPRTMQGNAFYTKFGEQY